MNAPAVRTEFHRRVAADATGQRLLSRPASSDSTADYGSSHWGLASLA